MHNPNKKNNTLDYAYWSKMDTWQLQEGISLILKVEPEPDVFVHRDVYGYRAVEFWKDFDAIAKIAARSIETGKLPVQIPYPNYLYCEIYPAIFIQWTKNKDIFIPEPLLHFLEQNRCSPKDDAEPIQDNTNAKIKLSTQTKQQCQAVARSLWDIYPDMSIEDMTKHHAILEYSGGKYYSGKNTLRGWLSEVDPRSPKQKTGRPPNKNTRET